MTASPAGASAVRRRRDARGCWSRARWRVAGALVLAALHVLRGVGPGAYVGYARYGYADS